MIILDGRVCQHTHSVAHHLLVFSHFVDLTQVPSSHGRLVRVAALHLLKLVDWKGISQKANPVTVLDFLGNF